MWRGGMAEPIEASQCLDLDRTIVILTIQIMYMYKLFYMVARVMVAESVKT